MATVRYIVHDVDESIPFYTEHLGFELRMHPAPPFAMLTRGDLRLALVSPLEADQQGGARALPDGTRQEPGGWNRFTVEVSDIEATVERLRAAGVPFRTDIVTGVGGKQALAQDPPATWSNSSNPLIPEAREG